jgi:peroxiredoxin
MRTAASSLYLKAANAMMAAAVPRRSISIGTNLLISSDVSLQKARPWYMSDSEGSNTAVDNAVTMKALFENKVVAMFGVPAPFTGTCSHEHYPPYKAIAKEFLDAGVNTVACYAVSDPYAHYGWSQALKNDHDEITFLADDGGAFAKEFSLETRYDAVSLGLRSIRFSMLVDNGIVKAFHVVEDATKDAEVLLADTKSMKES